MPAPKAAAPGPEPQAVTPDQSPSSQTVGSPSATPSPLHLPDQPEPPIGFQVVAAPPPPPPDVMTTVEAVDQVRKLHVLVTRMHALTSQLQSENRR